MKTKVFLTVALCAIFSMSSLAQEQAKRFGLELNGGLSLTTSKLSDVKADPGFGFEGTLHFRFSKHAGIYGGWGWNRFGLDQSFAGTNTCFEETGYVYGFQYSHQIANSPMSYYLRAGGLWNHIEIENTEGEIIFDSGHGFGWQVAAGLDINLGSNWSLTPGLKYNSLSTEIVDEAVIHDLNHNYLSVRIGIMKRF
jgi:opacity protein-like surface antigen